jgi:hypothetical protein
VNCNSRKVNKQILYYFIIIFLWVRAGATADGAGTLATCGQRRPRAGPPVVAAPQHARNKAKVSNTFHIVADPRFIPDPKFSIGNLG